MTSRNGNNFRVTVSMCGEFTSHQWIPSQRPVTRSFDFFYLRLNERLSKQSGRWLETPSYPLWRHCNVTKDLSAWGYLTHICVFFLYIFHLYSCGAENATMTLPRSITDAIDEMYSLILDIYLQRVNSLVIEIAKTSILALSRKIRSFSVRSYSCLLISNGRREISSDNGWEG